MVKPLTSQVDDYHDVKVSSRKLVASEVCIKLEALCINAVSKK